MPFLLLHTVDPCWQPEDINQLRTVLQETGLLAVESPPDPFADSRVGDRFLQLIMFLGCSPKVTLSTDEEGDGPPPCLIRFDKYDSIRFLASGHRATARCPRCRASALIDQPVANENFVCSGCGEVFPVQELDWRQAAGFGRFFIRVSGIYPHEAIPSDRLLACLQTFSHGDWKYFFM